VPPAPISAQTDTDPELGEWSVPWEQSRPRDPHVAPDGRVWFVGQRSHYAAVLDPESGEFTRFDLPDGTGPHNLVVDDDGIVWYTGNLQRHIGRLDPATGETVQYEMPDERARDPHTLIADSQGDMWFTVQGGNFIGKFWKETGEVRLVEGPATEGRGGRPGSSRPYGIVMDSRDRPWIALFNTNLIGTVDPETFELETFELPEGARPRRIGLTSDDTVWYVDYARGFLGRLDPESREVREFPMPGGEGSRPYGMAVDGDDRIWFVETGPKPNRFVGFDPENEDFFSVSEVESGGGSIRHMYFHEPSNTIWFGADANTVGRAVLPPKRRRIS
jgi:virginiamycin B lyase